MFLPIVDRELRVASRKARSYWTRWFTAGVAMALFWFTVWTAQLGARWSSGEIFQLLSWYAFVYCVLAGAISTGDCLSAEGRENTLGLLFLTDLKAYDVVLGKLAAHSLNSFLGLVAMLPVLGIPLLMGGVQYSEFWRVVLSLFTTLLLSLSLGMYVSASGQNAVRNTAAAVLLMCFLAFGLPAFCELLKSYRRWPALTSAIPFLSPFYTHSAAFSSAGWPALQRYAYSLVAPALLIVAWIGLSCRRLPRSWRDDPAKASPWSVKHWMARWRAWNLGYGERRNAFRTRLLQANPFAWLASRERVSSPGLVLLFTLGVLATAWIASLIPRTTRPSNMDDVLLLWLWLWSSAVLHLILLGKISSAACERFGEDRQSGALELLLCTPLRIREIVRGQWKALRRQLFGPALIALLVHWVVLLRAFKAFDNFNSHLTTRELIALTIHNLMAYSPEGAWPETMGILWITAAALVLASHWVTLGWVGMWLALRMRQPRFAPWAGLGIVLLPPWVLLALGIVGLLEFESTWSDARWFFVIFKMAFGLHLACDLILSLWAWKRIRSSFRLTAANRFDVAAPGVPWTVLAKHGLRWATIPAAAALLLGIFHWEENWRGERAWAALQADLQRRGERLDLASMWPPSVPDEKNFARAQGVRDVLAEVSQPVPPTPWGQARRAWVPSLSLDGQLRWYQDQSRNWLYQKPTDLQQWQTQYRASGLVPTNTGPRSASADVLLALNRLDPTLEEWRAASERPSCRYLDRASGGWGSPLAHLPVINSVSEVLRFRASAELAEGQSDRALEDINLCLYLADSLRDEPFYDSHARRQELLLCLLQPIWEGLADGCWSDAELRWLQGRLGEVQCLSEYPGAVRATMLAQMDFWQRKRSERASRGGVWRFTRLFSPVGWTYQSQAGVYDFLRHHLATLVDPESQRVFAVQTDAVVRRMNATGDFSAMTGHQLSALVQNYALVQTGYNMATTACALERFRSEHGVYPVKLEELLDRYIQALPHDVLSEEPLHYRRPREQEFTLYSVGLDEKDDGGKPADWLWKYPTLAPDNRP